MADQPKLPKSLDGHSIPQERLDLIFPIIDALADTALKVNDTLPLGANEADFIQVLETEGK